MADPRSTLADPPWRRALRRDCLREIIWSLGRAREARNLGEVRYAIRLLCGTRHDLGFATACFGPSLATALLRKIAMAIEHEIATNLGIARGGEENAP